MARRKETPKRDKTKEQDQREKEQGPGRSTKLMNTSVFRQLSFEPACSSQDFISGQTKMTTANKKKKLGELMNFINNQLPKYFLQILKGNY